MSEIPEPLKSQEHQTISQYIIVVFKEVYVEMSGINTEEGEGEHTGISPWRNPPPPPLNLAQLSMVYRNIDKFRLCEFFF